MRGPKKNLNLREAITLLVAKQLTYAQIAKEMGFSRQRVNEITKELGLKPKSGLIKQADPKGHRRKYVLEHKEKLNQQTREWVIKNAERHRQNCRNWQSKNRKHYNFLINLNKRMRRETLGKCTHSQWRGRVEACGWKCFYCKIILTPETLTMDHRIPITRHGTNWPANLVPACKKCNSRKHNKTEKEYRNL